MVSVTVENLSKSFGRVKAVDDVSFEVEAGELFFLLGPSGCGKTTVLRIIAGLCEADSGRVLFDGKRVDDLPAHRRNTGMVFQNYALWPHMSVRQNVQYGLDVRKLPRRERKQRVEKALAMVHMSDAADRKPGQLSGGQQQRVALARALVIEPAVVLLDEPLSNLDAKLRTEMRNEIRRVHEETKITMIYVTHDQKEALSLARRIAVIGSGRIEQIGTPREIYERPRNKFVARFIGETNLVTGKVAEAGEGTVTIATPMGRVVSSDANDALSPGREVTCSIRPEAVSFTSSEDGPNNFPAKVKAITYLGETEQYSIETGSGVELRVMGLNPAARETARGREVRITFDPSEVIVLID